MNTVYLASSSRWRANLLKNCGLNIHIVPPDVVEELIVGDSPTATATLRARAKAENVLSRVPTDAIVIGADQVVHHNGQCFGKPKDPKSWFERLKAFRGKGHDLTTAVSLFVDGVCTEFQEHSKVFFRGDITDQELRDYIKDGEARGCAGGYMVEQRGAWLIEKVEGDWLNVIGLPIFSIIKELRLKGLTVSHCVSVELDSSDGILL